MAPVAGRLSDACILTRDDVTIGADATRPPCGAFTKAGVRDARDAEKLFDFANGGVIAAFLALVAACSDSASRPRVGVDAGRDGSIALTPCTSNRDCAGGEVCREMFCRTSCEADADCTAPLGACDATLDYCVQCTDNADCGANQRCTANACEFYCTEDSACAATEFCRTDTGVCAARECESTRDCEGGFRCERFACIPIDDLVCTPDAETCSADHRTVQRCNADGTMQTMETCATDSRCVVNGSSAACAAVVCTPSALGCVDGATAFECDATGTVRTDTPCGSGRFCSMGVCQDLLCAPGSVRCEGNGTVTCDALGSMETFAACADRPECASSAFGCTCDAGACVTRICTPGATRCAAAGSQTCAADGRSWGATAACPAGQTCLVALGACATVTCTAGSRECFGEQLSECNATGTARSTTDCAATSRLCTGTAPTASCTARVCTPGAISCNAANTAVIECDARGAAQTTTACASGQVCRSGACVTLLCAPGSATTECATPTARRACASDGMSYVATACASGQSCNAGVCAVRCGDGIVGTGETCDDGNTVGGDGCSAVCGDERRLLSRGQPAVLSTERFPASNAVDGNYVSFAATPVPGELRPWWRVDLGRLKAIRRVEVWQRADCCFDEPTDFEIEISDDTMTWRTFASSLGTARRPSAYFGVGSGRYVRIIMNDRGVVRPLALAEVEVYGF